MYANLARWIAERVSEDPSVLGGSPVFKGTRLSVERVGRAAEELESELLEDYGYLTADDVRYAREYVALRCEPSRASEPPKAAAR